MKRYHILLLFASLALGTGSTARAQEWGYPQSFVRDSAGMQYGATKAISQTDGDALLRRSTIKPSNSLFGLLSGLTVMQQGGYASSASLSIRGRGSLNNNSILILVDGVERDLNTLVIEEIEDVVVLKDAAALAIYGMRGANGALLVTTKRGTEQKQSISVKYELAMGTPTRLPEFVDAPTYAQAYNEGLANEGIAPIYSDLEIEAYRSGKYPDSFANVDWMKETLRKWSTTHQASITATGGNKRIKYFSMLKYVNDQGLLRHTDTYPEYSTQLMRNILNIRTNLDIAVTRTTDVSINLLGRLAEQNRPGNVVDSEIMQTLYTLPANAFPVKNSDGIWGGLSGYRLNPVAETSYTGYALGHSRAILADLAITQRLDALVKGLKVFARASVDATAENYDGRTKQYLYESNLAQFDPTGELGPVTTTQYGREDKQLGFYSYLGAQQRSSNIQAGFAYELNNEKHKLSSAIFYRQDKYVGLGGGTTSTHQDIVAYGDWAYKDRYFVSASISGSGTSRLPKELRWGVFPAVALAWRADNEAFLKNSEAVDLLNIRASYGLTGNDLVTPYLDRYPFNFSGSFAFTDNILNQSGMAEQRLPSAHYTYEKAAKLNVGFDLRMFDLVTLSADAFYERRRDIMVNANTVNSGIVGITLSDVAEGVVDNRGVELTMNIGRQYRNGYFNIGGTFSFARNKIIDMNEEAQPYDYMKRTGHSTGQPFGLEVIGFFQNQEDIDGSPTQYFSEVYPGDYKYKDQNGDDRIDEYDVVALGRNSSIPELNYSILLDAGYKGLSLSAMFQGVGCYTVPLTTTGVYQPLVNNTTLSEHYLENCWRPNGLVTSALYPRLTTTGSSNNYRTNSALLANGAFLKLRYVELAYTLPRQWVNKIRMKEARVFVRGTDLFSIDRIDVLDPEVMNVAYPVLKTVQLGVSFSF